MGDRSQLPQERNEGQSSFFQRLFALLLGTDGVDREKRRQLKQIATSLNRQRYKFYKPRSGEALGGLAKFFFEIYRVVGPAQALLHGGEGSNAVKTILIETCLTDEQIEAHEHITEEAIRSAARNLNSDELSVQVKEAMTAYLSGFTSEMVTKINDSYKLIQDVIAFVRFDYFFTLRKFDPSLLEGAFDRPPRTDPVDAGNVSDDIKDFLEVLLALDFDADWDVALQVLGEYRGVDFVSTGAWRKLLNSLAAVARSGVLVQIVRHVDEDPKYRPLLRSEKFHIVEAHLTTVRNQVESRLQNIAGELKGQKVQQAAAAVFGSAEVNRIRYYTDAKSAEFAGRLVPGFAHTSAMNYLAAFLLDYFTKSARLLLSELLIVRATWAESSVSSQMSDAFYSTLSLADEIDQFDLSLGPDGELSARLRKATGPVKGNEAIKTRLLRQAVQDIDARAWELIKNSASNLIIVGRIVKDLISDIDLKSPEIVLNWKELEAVASGSLKEKLTAIYKKIYFFIQLLQLFVNRKK